MMHSPVTDGLWRPAGCALSLILAVWIVSIGGQPAIGQQAAVNEFRAYPLRYVSAEEAERTLAKLLPPDSEVLADQRSSRVLVRGSAVAHQTVRDALGSIDRSGPQPSAIPLQALSPPVLKGYACRAPDVAGLAARLEAEYASTGHVRVATDPRTAQVLVMAPPEIHTQIQARLASTQASPAPTAPPVSYSAQAPPPTGYSAQPAPPTGYSAPAPTRVAPAFGTPGEARREIRLQYTTGQQIETSLRAILGPRLLTALGGSVRAPAFEMTLRDGEVLQLAVNHQAGAVTVQGSNRAVEAFGRLIAALDKQPGTGGSTSPGQSTQLVALRSAKPADVRRAVDALRSDQGTTAAADGSSGAMMIARMFQQPDPAGDPAGDQTPIVPENDGATGDATAPAGDAPAAGIGSQTSLIGPVRVEFLEGLDVLVISGHRRDVERVQAIIADIERLSSVTQPVIDILQLQHVDCESLQTLLVQLYDEILSSRQGSVSITALVKPNALLLIGRQENVQTVTNLARRLDRAVPPETQFRVFHLRYTSALELEETAQAFFVERGGLGTKVLITSDFRTNSLVVRGSPRDIAEVAEMVLRLDTKDSGTVNELRVFQLENSLAEDLVPILQEAIGSQQQSISGAGGRTSGGQVPGGSAGRTSGSQRRIGEKSTMLQLVTLDPQGQRRLNSGILTDARITADGRSNSVVVSAPADSLALIEALIRQLDQLPAAEAQVKLFTIVNGDASGMADMLENLFGQPTGGQQQQLPIQTAVLGEDSTLVSMRFSVDVRTNSIIATGSIGDLQVVEAILMRLDESEGRLRKSVVYRLKNAPATDVALAVNQFLESERDVQQIEPGLLSAFEQMEREVVVVPEPVSNSLIVSATPRFFEEIEQLVLDLDERPPMVMIQVLIADVLLNSVDEFGIELGLQDSILFGRSEDGVPGFNFNNQPLGNGLHAAEYLAGQALSNFGVGRVSGETNYGGLVLSASSDSVSVLIRALKECRRVDVLSRPQVMTLDNQPAFIQVGQRVPQVTGTGTNLGTTTSQVTYTNVGLILGVTPRISPDGLVVMEIDTERSEVSDEGGIPISVSGGEVITAPRINTITAQTTISSLSGQTIVLGGLITKKKTKVSRRVPFLGDVPLAGHLFRYDGDVEQRTELLIIMTPHIVQSEEEAERIKQVEAARMNWCLRDVVQIHGLDSGVRTRNDEWIDAETSVIYPDLDPGVPPTAPTPAPTAPTPREMVPAPGRMVPPPSRAVPAPGRSPSFPQPPVVPAPSFRQPTPPPTSQQPNTPIPAATSQLQHRQQMLRRQTEPLVARPQPYPVQPAGYWATDQLR